MKPLLDKDLAKDRYLTSDYNHKARWSSFFYQIKLIREVNIKNVLEIGIGNGWVSRILSDYNIEVSTVDIDKRLNPDYVAHINSLPIKDSSYDAVCAFEVLEHLPFDEFVDNLKEMSRVSKKYVIISLPDKRRILAHFLFKIPFVKYIELFIKIPSFKKHIFDGRHFWEIGKIEYPVSKIKNSIKDSGLTIIKSFVPPDSPMNHYFVMKK